MISIKSKVRSLFLVAIAIGCSTQLSGQVTEDREDTVSRNNLVAEVNLIEAPNKSFYDMDEFLPEDHQSNTMIFREAKFDGGKRGMKSYLKKNFQYPEVARVNGIEGRMMAQFTITRDGQVTDVQITKSGGSALDTELIRVIESMPKWDPAVKYGYAAKSVVLLPFKAGLK